MSTSGSDRRYYVNINGLIIEFPSKADGSSLTDAEALSLIQTYKDVYGDAYAGKTATDSTEYVLDWDATPPAFE